MLSHLPLLSLVLASLFAVPVGAADANIPTVDQIIETAEKTLSGTKDYSGKLLRQELFLDGMKKQLNTFKFKKPFSVYLRFIDPFGGREVIFVRGWNDDEIKVHKGSFPDITVSLDPRGSRAMERSHHPVTQFGFENTLKMAAKNLRLARQRGEGEIKVSDGGVINGQPVWKIEARFPKVGNYVTAKDDETLWDISKRTGQDMYLLLYTNQDKKYDEPDDVDEDDRVFIPRYYGGQAEFHVAKETSMPVRVIIRDWQGRLYEQYDYSEVKLNVGLTRKDFDPDNKEYNF
jgi:outer membrane lipoprotein-sorting protein